jgi:hypothetical protein
MILTEGLMILTEGLMMMKARGLNQVQLRNVGYRVWHPGQCRVAGQMAIDPKSLH